MPNLNTSNSNYMLASAFACAIMTSNAVQLPDENHKTSSDESYYNLSDFVNLKTSQGNVLLDNTNMSYDLSSLRYPSIIKDSFKLNMTDLSKLIGISRPTAYKYINGKITNENHWTTINELYELSNYWKEIAQNLPIGMEIKRNYDNKNLISLVNDNDFENAKILLTKIAKVVVSRYKNAQKNEAMLKHGNFNPDMIRKSVS